MKKYILFLLLALSVFTTNVYADTVAPNDCIKNHTCMVVCNYENNFSGIMRSMTIYYHFDGKWEVRYWNQIANSYGGEKGPDSFGKIFGSSGSPDIYLLTGVNSTNFSCPEHGYFDRNAFTELCFADTKEACEKKSGWMTSFGSKDSDFKSDKKDYDYEDHIVIYPENLLQEIYADITSGKMSTNDIPEKVKKDIQDNFLYGNTVPTFIENSDAFKTIQESVKQEYEKYKKQEEAKAAAALKEAEEAAKKAEEQLNNGEITENEYEEIKNAQTEAEEEYENVQNNWEATGEEVASGVGEVLKRITTSLDPIVDIIDFGNGDSCESFLGNPQYNSFLSVQSPAYYLQFMFNLIKYAAIILLFILTVIEFAKATASNDQDAMKKALKVSVKRLIICVIIFLLPILIKFMFTILGIYSDCNIS